MNKKQKPTFITSLLSALRPANYADGVTARARNGGEEKKKKVPVHKQGHVFRPIRILNVTPAQYRHLHLGRKK